MSEPRELDCDAVTNGPGPDATSLLVLANDAAHRAGDLLLRYLGEGEGHASLRTDATAKSSATDLVTRADRASEELIVERILAARPDDGIFGEEGSRRPGSSGIEWVIDPIDGTTNFLYRYRAFCVSIAATDADGALVGVVHDPLGGETFAAVRGGGSFLNGEPIPKWHTSPPLGEALVATGFGYRSERRRIQAKVVAAVLPAVRDIRRGGSAALDLCSVAVGRVDAFYEAGLGRWDREAGVLVATEAGLVAFDDERSIDGARTLIVTSPPLVGPLRVLLDSAFSCMSGDDVVIAAESFGTADALAMSAAYYRELAERFTDGYEGNKDSQATPDDLEDPRGCYLVARVGGKPVGCVALRRHDESTGELKHMWVSGPQRRRGIARRLVDAAEERAEGMGMRRVILDTRSELPEAVSLYRSAGYVEISAYNENPYADRWFEKRLSPR